MPACVGQSGAPQPSAAHLSEGRFSKSVRRRRGRGRVKEAIASALCTNPPTASRCEDIRHVRKPIIERTHAQHKPARRRLSMERGSCVEQCGCVCECVYEQNNKRTLLRYLWRLRLRSKENHTNTHTHRTSTQSIWCIVFIGMRDSPGG